MQIPYTYRPVDSKSAEDKIYALAEEFTEHICVSVIGKSVLSKKIRMLSIGNGPRSYLYVGAHHGMEWITSAVLLGFAEDILLCRKDKHRECYGMDISRMLSEHKIYVIPMLNPDGVDYAIHGVQKSNPLYERLTRKFCAEDFSRWQSNARGVDLNHNYDAGFYEYKALERELGISEMAPTRFSGPYPESEPEVASLCRFIRSEISIRAVLTLHSQGEEIYYTSRARCPAQSERIAHLMSLFSSYTPSVPSGAAAHGGLTDWIIDELGIPSFTVECGKGQNPLPISDCEGIYSQLRRVLFTLPYLCT